MWLLRVVVALAVLGALAPGAMATDRYYRDSFAVSPNGKFRIDAKSPDNAGPRPRPFAADFTYTLTESATKRVIWERKQPMTRSKGESSSHPAEASPVAVFVNDDGVVAARLAWDNLIFLDAKDGHKRAEADALGAFPADERDKYVSQTTAGPRWSQESEWYFMSVAGPGAGPGSLYFVVRPYWNHRLIIDVVTGKHVDLGENHSARAASDLATVGASEAVTRLVTVAIEEETRRALAVLAATPENLRDDNEYRVWWQVRAALHTVGFLQLVQAEADLRALEESLDETKEADLRAKVREALRAIGKVPSAGFGVRLYPMIAKEYFSTPDRDHPYKAVVPVVERVANAGKIGEGMTTKELTDLLGCPDAEVYDGGRSIDYDIDDPSPYTLRVALDQKMERVERVRRITPFAFLHDPARMRGY